MAGLDQFLNCARGVSFEGLVTTMDLVLDSVDGINFTMVGVHRGGAGGTFRGFLNYPNQKSGYLCRVALTLFVQ